MELAVMIEGQNGVTWEQWRAIAQACEEHGIPTLFRSDHYLNFSGAHPDWGSLDAWGTLCGMAAVTTNLRLGTLVSPVGFRHPSVLAKLVTTADQISGGRVELGIGAGWNQQEHAAHGLPFPDTRTRMAVLEEHLQIAYGHWGAEPFSFDGKHYRLQDLRAEPKPVQKPHPRVIIGGLARPRAAALAARYADEYNLVYLAGDEITAPRDRIFAACAEVGREPIAVSLMLGVLTGLDDAELRTRADRVGAFMGISGTELLANPPNGWIVGALDDVAVQLRAVRDLGISRVMCQHLAHADLEFIALLGERLAPLVG